MPPAGLEPAIPASDRPQTHPLDRVATGSGNKCIYRYVKLLYYRQRNLLHVSTTIVAISREVHRNQLTQHRPPLDGVTIHTAYLHATRHKQFYIIQGHRKRWTGFYTAVT
jgi:hypothetical protein